MELANTNITKSLTSLNNTTLSLFNLKRKTQTKVPTNIGVIIIRARFGRPIKRRNSLRRKLTQNHNLVKNGKLVELEGWVEEYQRDVEFWGIGTNPIFTVFQDCNGNVKRVWVDEDEILRRNGVVVVDLELEAKISYAKLIASEIECGRHVGVFSKNSSVAKFVQNSDSVDVDFVENNTTSVQNSDSVEKNSYCVQNSYPLPLGLLPNLKLSGSRVGLAMLCVFVFVWGMQKLLNFGEREKVSRFEKEMLRRKIKWRMEKDELGNSSGSSSVEVIQPYQTAAIETKRPVVDKEELLNSIRKPNNNNASSRTENEMDGEAVHIENENKNENENEIDGQAASHIENDMDGEAVLETETETERWHRHINHRHRVGGGAVQSSDVRRKPKIIVSVKEARNYLSLKHQPNEDINVLNEENQTSNEPSYLAANQHSYLSANASVQYSKTLEANDLHTGNPTLDLDDDSVSENIVGNKDKWLEVNFHEAEGVVRKIGDGFRNNYMVAREKVKEEDMGLELGIKHVTQLEWMQDDDLRDIVFRVRENELAGRDPFHSMNPQDKNSFFKGLETLVEKENQNLSTLHHWLHSNIENLDYGTDGISLYDPPEKVVPRWKGPPLDKLPEFLTNRTEQQKVTSFLRKSNESPQHDGIEVSGETSSIKSKPTEVVKIAKTLIEASDGSIKPGNKSGKEYWKHTKRWSRGFVESYNAETDPEVKTLMKDIGKDLDRWITEEEIQETANLMDKIPQKGKEYIENKLNKLKREMEQFGPAAVVSKYREYAEDKEEDYLWWLDLQYVLCIELYTYEGKDQKVGFYSLEMAADLELDPKPHHVIAFEDPGDCKNLCYIIQAHLEMLGSSQAYVVAQPPKDVFWQAKSNGFFVTVIKRGELLLNVDQPLEEVEESITEIGSKMYHDKITQERSLDVDSLMKGVFGISKPSKRIRKKQARKHLGRD